MFFFRFGSCFFGCLSHHNNGFLIGENRYTYEHFGKNTLIYDGDEWIAKIRGRHDMAKAIAVEV